MTRGATFHRRAATDSQIAVCCFGTVIWRASARLSVTADLAYRASPRTACECRLAAVSSAWIAWQPRAGLITRRRNAAGCCARVLTRSRAGTRDSQDHDRGDPDAHRERHL